MKFSDPTLIDCHYIYPQFAGAYLVTDLDRAFFVDNNTSHAVPFLLKELNRQGMDPSQVEYLIITHVHLDHAGGSSALLEACPQAKILAHPKAAQHIIDPSKLIRSARQVYGDKHFEALYGKIKPIPTERVRVISDGEEIQFGTRCLRFFYTRGHANHHLCIMDSGDSGSGGVFTGDAFGVAYPALQRNGLLIFPSTSPTDFDPVEANISLQKIVDSGAKRAFLTHFGEITAIQEAAQQMLRHLEFHEELLNRAIQGSIQPGESLESFCLQEVTQYFKNVLEKQGLASDSDAWKILTPDIQLNAAGIAWVAKKRLL